MRLSWLDQAKAFGIILVFYGHIVEQLQALSSNSAYLQYKFIYAFHIPLFFILSGYVAKNLELNLKSRFASRIIPVITFNLIGFLILVVVDVFFENKLRLSHYTYGIIGLFVKGYPHFNFMTWYLVCLFTIETIDFLMQKYLIKNNKTWVAYTITIFIFGVLLSRKADFFSNAAGIRNDFWFFNQALIGYFFYQAGKAVKKHKILEEKQSIIALPLTFVASVFVLCFTFNLNLTNVNVLALQLGNPLLFIITAIAGSTVCILLCKVLPTSPIINFIGRNTLMLLGINGIFVHFLNEKLARYMISVVPDKQLMMFLACSLATIVSLALSVPFILAANRFAPQWFGRPQKPKSLSTSP